jgi:hypothetical protein
VTNQLVCCRFTLRKAIAVYRSRLRCSGVANATPKRLFGADCARAEGQLQRYRVPAARSNAPLPPNSSCSLHMLVILPTGTNRMNSCRWTANHEHLTSALRCKRYAEQSPETLLQHSKQLACSTSQGEVRELFKVRLVRHTPSQQAPTSQVFAANPTRGAVLNSAAAALHASDETVVVQMQSCNTE